MTDQKNLLKVRQICFMIIALLPVTKFAFFPGFSADMVGEGLWLSAIIGFVVDFGVLALALLLSKKHPERTLYEIVSEGVGEWAAKILFFIYALFFLCKAALPILEKKLYIERTLYEVMPKPFIFYPLFIVSFYACLKGLKIFGRVSDITVGITVLSVALVFALAVPSGDYTNLLPLFKVPVKDLFLSSFRTSLWQTDGIYLLMLLGCFRKERGYAKKIAFSYIGSAIAVVAYLCVFYAIYGAVSASQTFALPSITVFSVNATNAGRFDYIAIFLLLVPQIFSIIIPLFFCTDCLKEVFGAKSRLVPSICVNAGLALFTFLFGHKFNTLLTFTADYLSYFFLFTAVVITVLLLFIPKRRTNEAFQG